MPSFFNARQLMFSAQYSSCIITISISTTVSTKTITTIETLAIQSLYVKGSTIINGLLMFPARCSELFLQYNNDNLYNSVNKTSVDPGAGIGCNVMVRTKIQNTELQNTKDTNVPFNWPGSSAGTGSRHSAQGGEDKGRVGGGLLATPGTLPNVHCY